MPHAERGRSRSPVSLTWLTSALLLTLLASAPAQAAQPGDLDRSFSHNGKVTTAFGRSAALAAAVDLKGRIVAGGTTGGGEFGLARYKRNGELDRTFSGNGKTRTSFRHYAAVDSLAIDSRGRIVAAGRGGDGFAVARYKPNGDLDYSFDADGKVTTDFGIGDVGESVAIDSRGRIVVA